MKLLRSIFLAALTLCLVMAIAVLLLVHRGFRAGTVPPPWEASVARTVRDFAIPARERADKNPVPATPEALQRGRDLFFNVAPDATVRMEAVLRPSEATPILGFLICVPQGRKPLLMASCTTSS